MSILKKVTLILIPLVLFSLFPVFLCAQSDMNKQDSMGKQDQMGNNMGKLSATGCLKQGSDNGGYYIVGEDGKMYELWGKGLAEHVNHKVTVTGMQETVSAGEEKKREMSEKTEADGATPVDMKVHHIKHISDKCE